MERHEPIEGLPLAQNTHIEEAFEPLSQLGFDRVIELGTQNGGFTIFLSGLFPRVITFDNKVFGRTMIKFKEIPNISFHERNIFFKNSIAEIANHIQEHGRALVLCDNGNKIREVDTFAPYLKPGDVIMAHDYAKSRQYFKDRIQGRYWNHLEITDSDIDFEKHGIKHFMTGPTEKAAWFCAIKK